MSGYTLCYPISTQQKQNTRIQARVCRVRTAEQQKSVISPVSFLRAPLRLLLTVSCRSCRPMSTRSTWLYTSCGRFLLQLPLYSCLPLPSLPIATMSHFRCISQRAHPLHTRILYTLVFITLRGIILGLGSFVCFRRISHNLLYTDL